MSVRTCPVCSSQLVDRDHEGVHLDACPSGCGTWLDRGELRAVVESEVADRSVGEEDAARAAAAADGGRAVVADAFGRPARACSVCRAAMLVREYPGSGVAIDECAEHGVWLDAGELERIEAYAEAMRREVATGAAGGAPTPVRGIPIPPHVLGAARAVVGAPPAG